MKEEQLVHSTLNPDDCTWTDMAHERASFGLDAMPCFAELFLRVFVVTVVWFVVLRN